MSDNDQRSMYDKAKNLVHDATETLKERIGGGGPNEQTHDKHRDVPKDFNDGGVEYTDSKGERMIRLP